MGVRGLTTYVNRRSDLYFECYKLEGCHLIVDGYSLAAVLYNNMIKCNTAFGGDYDRYSKEVEDFVRALEKCRVVPVFVFDGGYERKKLATVRKRLEAKVCSLETVGPSSAPGCQSSYPLMMRQVLRDKLFEMGTALVQSDFEADGEIAALARKLSCPVLSNDSDFLIFDVLYIPLSSMTFRACRDDSTSKYYMDCEIYRVEKFLDSFGGLSKTMLPLLATLLGNDYIARSTFKDFYSRIKMSKGKKNSELQRRIAGILEWLRKETFESAVCKILSRSNRTRRRLLARKLKLVVRGYTHVDTPLLAYLPANLADRTSENMPDGCSEVRNQLEKGMKKCDEVEVEPDGAEETTSSESERETGSSASDEEELSSGEEDEENISSRGIPNWLLEEARKGRIHSCVITIVSLKTYFFVPQVEDTSSAHAGQVAVPILAHLCGLLVGDHPVNSWFRQTSHYSRSVLTPITQTENYGKFPRPSCLNKLSPGDRLSIITDIVGVGDDFLKTFPDDWKLFIISAVYWMRNSVVQPYHAHALVVMAMVVKVLDAKIGHFRNKRPFMQRHGSKLKSLLKEKPTKTDFTADTSVEVAIDRVSTEDCLVIFENFLPYFHTDDNLTYKPGNFSRSLVHRYAEFQACVDAVNVLNGVLLHPYTHCRIGAFYYGTFLYNFASNLKKRANLPGYLQSFFAKTPTLMNLYNAIVASLDQCLPKIIVKVKKKKKKQPADRTKKDESVDNARCDSQMSSDNDTFVDMNNRFSMLRT